MSALTREEHPGSLIGPLLTVPLVGMSAYLLCAVTPYLVDVDCSKPGYTPASLTSCLPKTEIAQTYWEVSVPIDGVTYYITRDRPFIQVAPTLIFYLSLYGSGVMVLLVLLSAFFRKWEAPSAQPISVEVVLSCDRKRQYHPIDFIPKKGLRTMSKPSLMNRNFCSASLMAWCRQLDQEAIALAILENTSTQFQFHLDGPADDSGEVSASDLDIRTSWDIPEDTPDAT